jgi:hypothetical protein
MERSITSFFVASKFVCGNGGIYFMSGKGKKIVLVGVLGVALLASLATGTAALYQKEVNVGGGTLTAANFVLVGNTTSTWSADIEALSPGKEVSYAFTVTNKNTSGVTGVTMDLDFDVNLSKLNLVSNSYTGKAAIPYLLVTLKNNDGNTLLQKQYGEGDDAVGHMNKSDSSTSRTYLTTLAAQQGATILNETATPDDYFVTDFEEILRYTLIVRWSTEAELNNGTDYNVHFTNLNVNNIGSSISLTLTGTQSTETVTLAGNSHHPAKLGNQTDFGGGFGSETYPYIILNKQHWLNMLSSTYNSGDHYFKLSDYVDSDDNSTNGYDGILDLGDMSANNQLDLDKTYLDGNNKKVSYTSSYPLFRVVSEVEIKNLTFYDVTYYNNYSTGTKSSNRLYAGYNSFIAGVIDTTGDTRDTIFNNVDVQGAHTDGGTNAYTGGSTSVSVDGAYDGLASTAAGETSTINDKKTTMPGTNGAGVFATRAYLADANIVFTNCDIKDTYFGTSLQPAPMAGFIGWTTLTSTAGDKTSSLSFNGCGFDGLTMYSYSSTGRSNWNPYTNIFGDYWNGQYSGQTSYSLRFYSNVYTVNNIFVDNALLYSTTAADGTTSYDTTAAAANSYFNSLTNSETRSALPVSNVTTVIVSTPTNYANSGSTVYNPGRQSKFQLNGVDISGIELYERKAVNANNNIRFDVCNGTTCSNDGLN